MSQAEPLSRVRMALLGFIALMAYAIAAALFVLGIALLVVGILSWLHPIHVAVAWARTLAGVGLIGSGAAFAALGRLAVAAMADREIAISRKLKFAALIGILLALICLPFAAAIKTVAHASWLGGA